MTSCTLDRVDRCSALSFFLALCLLQKKIASKRRVKTGIAVPNAMPVTFGSSPLPLLLLLLTETVEFELCVGEDDEDEDEDEREDEDEEE